jgi:hypothetical protein
MQGDMTMHTHAEHRLGLVLLAVVLAVTVVACGATATPTKVPPTATPVPPTATKAPPTATPVPPTATAVPPTATKVALTATPAPMAPAASPSVAAGGATAADRELVGAVFANLAKAQSFAMKINMDTPTSTIPFTGTIVMEIAQTPTQTIHMKIGDQLETIVAGPDVYTKMGTTWQKSTMAIPQIQQMMSSFDYSKSLKPEDLATLSVTRTGSEKVNNVDTEMYTLVMPQGQTVKLWINKTDKTVVKLMQQDKSGTFTVTFSDWNNVKIDLPK